MAGRLEPRRLVLHHGEVEVHVEIVLDELATHERMKHNNQQKKVQSMLPMKTG
jgi:hypothetical protein